MLYAIKAIAAILKGQMFENKAAQNEALYRSIVACDISIKKQLAPADMDDGPL